MRVVDVIGSLRQSAVTVLAVAFTGALAWAVDPEPGLLVFAVLLTISLAGSQLERSLRGRLEAGAALPVIALVGAATGALLAAAPWVGAAVFTLVLTVSVAMRLLGPVGRRLGSLVAFPFTVLLVAPVRSERLAPVPALVVTIAVGLVAWASVTVLQLAAQHIGLLPRSPSSQPPPREAGRPSPGRRRATRNLSVQMAVVLGGAFAIGYLLFPDRWSWVVVSALVVSLGNAGRADATYKALHRVAGAVAGSALAVLLLSLHPTGPGLAAAVTAALVVGVVLRPLGYGWWAAAITVALALTQSMAAGDFSLVQRFEEILIGSGLAVAVSWAILPVRSSDVVRARIGDVLARLSEALASRPSPDALPAAPEAAPRMPPAKDVLAPLVRVAVPFDALRAVPARWRPPAYHWIATTRTAASLVLAGPRATLRRPVADARRAVRDPAALQGALDELVAAARG